MIGDAVVVSVRKAAPLGASAGMHAGNPLAVPLSLGRKVLGTAPGPIAFLWDYWGTSHALE